MPVEIIFGVFCNSKERRWTPCRGLISILAAVVLNGMFRHLGTCSLNGSIRPIRVRILCLSSHGSPLRISQFLLRCISGSQDLQRMQISRSRGYPHKAATRSSLSKECL